MSLTDRAITNLKTTGKVQKHFDGGGLHIYVSPSGGKLWRMAYRFNGKAKTLSFGAYPAISLKRARDLRDEAKALLADGIDPSEYKKEMKKLAVEQTGNSFEMIAREWHLKFRETWTPSYAASVISRLERNVFPYLGKVPIATIKPADVLAVIRRIEARGALETAHRILQICGKVFRYAVATSRAERDVTIDLRGALPPTKVKHHATILDPKEIGHLLRAIDGYQGQHVPVGYALKLSPLVFLRPSELRCAEWNEFDWENAEWRIPKERMKMRRVHIVPLARQTLEILQALRDITGYGQFLFPSIRTASRPMSNNTVNAALRRLGYGKDEITGHGFRSMASTLLNEQGWNPDAIERQLAHSERNHVRAAYNFAEFMPERRKMMQFWADYLDSLK